jgi:hypothetical protein
MNQEKIIKSIPSFSIYTPPSRMFTYPSKLIDTYVANVMDIVIPSHTLNTNKFKFKVYKGSTSDSSKPFSFKFKKLDRLERKISPSISLENTYIYDARYAQHWALAHVLVDLISFLLEIKELIPPNELTVILPRKTDLMGVKILREFGYNNIVSTNKDVKGKILEVIVNDNPSKQPDYCISNVFSQLDFPGYSHETPEKVFIARKGRRKIINETEVEEFLNKYGFKKVYFEDIPLTEQWSIAKNAKVVVTPHGAAMTNLLFNDQMVKCIELSHPGFIVDYHRNIIYVKQGSWCRVTGEITDDILGKIAQKHNYFAPHDIRIDLRSLEMALDYMEIK